MKRVALCCLIVLLAVAPLSAEAGKLVRLDGWIVDSYCGVKNANSDGADCILECHEKGAKLIFVDGEGTSYSIDDQEQALEHVGVEIGVFGTVDEDRNLTVGKFIPKKVKPTQG